MPIGREVRGSRSPEGVEAIVSRACYHAYLRGLFFWPWCRPRSSEVPAQAHCYFFATPSLADSDA